MKALKITGVVIVAIWMGFTSWRLEYAIKVAEAACSIATIQGLNGPVHIFKNTIRCPFAIALQYPDDVRPQSK
jgi:hypothetical protein